MKTQESYEHAARGGNRGRAAASIIVREDGTSNYRTFDQPAAMREWTLEELTSSGRAAPVAARMRWRDRRGAPQSIALIATGAKVYEVTNPQAGEAGRWFERNAGHATLIRADGQVETYSTNNTDGQTKDRASIDLAMANALNIENPPALMVDAGGDAPPAVILGPAAQTHIGIETWLNDEIVPGEAGAMD